MTCGWDSDSTSCSTWCVPKKGSDGVTRLNKAYFLFFKTNTVAISHTHTHIDRHPDLANSRCLG